MTPPFAEHGSLIAAPFIGMAFGWYLERAGLGYAPKLAGQFYFRDFTVFKVMFSALLTAMLGLFWMNRLGVLDVTQVYLPETFAAPQAIGGTVFGIGFVLAGLRPGTSCVAAAAGKLDGLLTMTGILGGILLFNAAFPWLAGFYRSTELGPVTLTEVIGMSTGTGIALITAVALAGFAGATWLENKG